MSMMTEVSISMRLNESWLLTGSLGLQTHVAGVRSELVCRWI